MEQAHLNEMENRLKELDSRIKDLEPKVRSKLEHVETHLKEFEDLRAKHKSAHDRLNQIRKETREEWKTLKSGWDEIVKDIQESLDRVASEY